MDKGRRKHEVVDYAAVERFVRDHNIPNGIIVRESLNSAVVAALVKAGGEWTDPATGEVLDVPGIAVRESDPILVVTTAPEAEDCARAALAPFVAPELGR